MSIMLAGGSRAICCASKFHYVLFLRHLVGAACSQSITYRMTYLEDRMPK